jgi:hydrogenase maturation protease
MAHVLVLGIGNPLRADDGAGVHAALRLAARARDRRDVVILDAGTLSFPVQPAVNAADALIAIDAAPAGGPPGALTVHEGEAFDRFVSRRDRRPVEGCLAEILGRARRAGQLPARRVLIHLEPAVLDWGFELSPPVAAALVPCAELALAFIERWSPPSAPH